MLHPDQFKDFYESEHGSAKVTPHGYVYNVHIKEEARGQGHGTALMEQIISHADRLQKPLTLHAREDLHPWYRRLEFSAPDPTFSGDFTAGEMDMLVRKPRGDRGLKT